ncbi:MAG: TRAP transporter small permease [Pseudomonadota bacterium]
MRLIRLARDFATQATGFLGKIAIVLMMLHIGLDLVLRVIIGTAPEGMPETVARIYMVMAVFLPLALAQSTGRQIEVAFFSERLPPGLRHAQAIFAAFVTAAVAGLLAYLSFGVAVEATLRWESVELLKASLPIWPSRWAVVAGFGALAFCALLKPFEPTRRSAEIDGN